MSINTELTREAHAPTARDVVGLRSLWKEAFGDGDGFLDDFFATAYSAERCRCITEKGEVAAALYWLDSECNGARLAYIYAVATRVSHRGRGLCRSLMEQTHRHLAALGYGGVVLVPSEDTLFDYYGGLGYRTCSEISESRVLASEPPAELHRVDKYEYAARRRAFLPSGGVLQENQSLDFLATYAELYSGEDFLLAASRAGGRLLGIELLGNAAAAPSIVSALGCDEGELRIPPSAASFGKKRRFAMFLGLKEGVRPPDYFGIAFD